MTLARSVADVLDQHVVFEAESIDRMYLNVWQPRLAYGGGVSGFFVGHRGHHYASTALMDPMTKAFVADIHGFVAARGLELVHFAKGQRKDDLAQQFLAKFAEPEGVLFVGRAQEKAGVWHTQRRYNPVTGGSYAWLVRSSAFINFFYFYCVDADFGPYAERPAMPRLVGRAGAELGVRGSARHSRVGWLQDQRVSRKARSVSGGV
jgi:hypothetical protein